MIYPCGRKFTYTKNAHEIKITEGAYFESEIMYGYENFLVCMSNSALQTEQLKYDDLTIFVVVALLFSRSGFASVNIVSSTAPQTSSDRIQFSWPKPYWIRTTEKCQQLKILWFHF